MTKFLPTPHEEFENQRTPVNTYIISNRLIGEFIVTFK